MMDSCEIVWPPDIDVLFCQELCNRLLLPSFEAPVTPKKQPFTCNPRERNTNIQRRMILDITFDQDEPRSRLLGMML